MTRPEAEVLATALHGRGLGVEIKANPEGDCVVLIPFLNVDFAIVKPVTISKIVEDMEDLIGLLK